MSFLSKALGVFKGTLRGVDLFGRDIFISYKNQNKFKTHLGGCSTITVVFLMIAYAVYLLQVMFRRQSIFYSMNTVITDLTKASEDHYPAQNGFAVGLGFRYTNVSLLDEEMLRYYKVEFWQKVSVNSRDGTSEDEWTELEVSKCTSDLFPYVDQDLISRYGINNYV